MNDNLVLGLRRAMRGDIAGRKVDTIELEERVGLIEGAVSSMSRRLDRMGGDVGQIKRRRELVDAV